MCPVSDQSAPLGQIVITGAGTCGLALATLLLLKGVPRERVMVLEAHSGIVQSGEVILRPCGTRVLRACGVYDQVLARTRVCSGMEYRDPTSTAKPRDCAGRHPARDELSQAKLFNKDVFDDLGMDGLHRSTPSCGPCESMFVPRSVLVNTLYAALPEGIVRFGTKVNRVVENDTHVDIHITAPHPHTGQEEAAVLKADVVVGADGRFSKVRRSAWRAPGGQPEPHKDEAPLPDFAGWSALTWTLDEKSVKNSDVLRQVAQRRWMQAMLGVNILGAVIPVGGGKLTVATGLPDSYARTVLGIDQSSEVRTLSGHDMRALAEGALALCGDNEYRQMLRDAIRAAGWDADGEDAPHKWSMCHMNPPPKLHTPRCRVVLAGDSAKAVVPMTVMGANLALEDACVLADALSAAYQGAVGLPAALQTYDSIRRPRHMSVLRFSRQRGIPTTTGKFWFTRTMMRLVGYASRWLPRAIAPPSPDNLMGERTYDATMQWQTYSSSEASTDRVRK